MAGKQWGELIGQAEAGPEPIPDGIYDLVVHTAKSQPAKTGAPMIVAVMKVVVGPYAGKTVWHNFVLTEDNPNALGFFFKHMAALGIDQSTISQLPPPDQGGLEQLAQMIVGRYITANVAHRLWQGTTRNQLGDIRPYQGGTPQVQNVTNIAQYQQPQPQPQYAPQPQPVQPQQPYVPPQYVPPQPAPQQPAPQPQPVTPPQPGPTPYAAPYAVPGAPPAEQSPTSPPPPPF